MTTTAHAISRWYMYLLWVIGAGLVGYMVTAVFSGVLHLPRSWFLVPYTVVAGTFVYSYFRWSKVELGEFVRHNWLWGVLAAIALGIFVVNNILSQPASPRSQGLQLVFDLLWVGIVYGTLDAMLLSVLPVYATWRAFSQLGWASSLPGKIGVGALAIVASLFVTAAYHLGYLEYRGLALVPPIFGNGMMSLGYVVTGNPIAAVFSHVAMHVAGVLHGPATVVQLPPHH